MLNTTSPADDFMSLLGDQNLFCDKTPISFKNNPPALAFTEKKKLQGLRTQNLLFPLNFLQFSKGSFPLDADVPLIRYRGEGHLCGHQVPWQRGTTVLMVPVPCWGLGFPAERLWCFMA